MRCLLSLSVILLLLHGSSNNESLSAETCGPPAIIPKPAKMILKDGKFFLLPETAIYSDTDFESESEYLLKRLEAVSGCDLRIFPLDAVSISKFPRGSIILRHNKSLNVGEEGYHLEVDQNRVFIESQSPSGVFYGIQTLFQLFPPEIYGNSVTSGVEWSAQAVSIKDSSRFGWRAYLLDDARWFHGVGTIKKMLDQLAFLKMNVLHWYLTDDQGWRIEIKRYPKLTEVGSRRKDSQIGWWRSEKRAGEPHAGFYSQEQIREVVRYAAARHITVVPVVSMPGHASAAIASYPEMGNTGKSIEVPVTFGVKYDTFNVADENVYAFLENILEEVMQLFPSRVIHLGGDEVRFDQWMASSQIKELMEQENLSGPADVQRYFTNRMSKFLESKGKRMMGWNDILGHDLHGFLKSVGAGEISNESGAGKLARNTIINFWKGDIELAEKAVKEGHEIVNSLSSSTYLDYTYETIPLRKAYLFDPIPEGLPTKYHDKILGLGCQMWGEWIPTRERLEFQTFPRLAAYAETGWTQPEKKNLDDFLKRLEIQKLRWKLQSINYAEVP